MNSIALVEKNEPPALSQGWTIVLMNRASRFLWELHCGSKDQQLFKRALNTLVEVIEQTEDLSLFTDGERRYGNLLFDICHEVIRDGKPGRPPKRLPKGIRVRLKNKGAKKRVGRPRKKYEAPVPEHPQTETKVVENEIHANHAIGIQCLNATAKFCFSSPNEHLCEVSSTSPKNPGFILGHPQLCAGAFNN